MEEEKVVKKNNKPLLIIAISVILIAAGAILIVTGNNKSFIGKEEKEEPKQEDTNKPTDDPVRVIPQVVLTEEEATQILNDKKQADFADQEWQIGAVRVLAHDENNEKILVEYEEINGEGIITPKQTIISILNDEKTAELPGWVDGERDLTVYNFIYYETEVPTDPTVPVEPTDPKVPVEPIDPTVPVEPTDPTVPVEPTDPTVPVEPTDPTVPVEPVNPTEPETPVETQPTE